MIGHPLPAPDLLGVERLAALPPRPAAHVAQVLPLFPIDSEEALGVTGGTGGKHPRTGGRIHQLDLEKQGVALAMVHPVFDHACPLPDLGPRARLHDLENDRIPSSTTKSNNKTLMCLPMILLLGFSFYFQAFVVRTKRVLHSRGGRPLS